MWERNLALFREKYGDLASMVASADCTELQWCRARSGEENLCLEDGSDRIYLQSSYDVSKESRVWMEGLGLSEVTSRVLYVYGLGTGASFDVLQGWLRSASDNYLVYFEDDLRVIRRVLETERGGALLAERQVLIVYTGGSAEDCDVVCEDLAYYFVGLSMSVAALPSYAHHRADRYQDLEMRLRHKTVYVTFASQEFLAFGRSFFSNYYQNLRHLPSAYRGAALFDKFRGVPAIICGAGPSLDRNFDVLKGLDRKALIFAGGSAVNALTNRGLFPHFGATVDPNPEQMRRMSMQSGYQVPFFFKGRTHCSVLDSIPGPHLFLPGNVGYPVSDWIEKELGVYDTFVREGHNVLHMTIELARLLGCDPIIFVGMDLAYTDKKLYASEVVATTQVTDDVLTEGTDLNNNAFLRPDINGQPVYTLWKWIAESHYTSGYVKAHDGIRFINATEGGIGAEGLENMPLRQVAETVLQEDYDLRGRIHAELQSARFDSVTVGEICEVLTRIKQSLEDSKAICDSLVQDFAALRRALDVTDIPVIQELSPKVQKAQADLGGQLAQVEILSAVNHIRSVLFERRYSEIEGGEEDDERQRLMDQCQANEDEAYALGEAATINLQVLNAALDTMHRTQETVPCETDG